MAPPGFRPQHRYFQNSVAFSTATVDNEAAMYIGTYIERTIQSITLSYIIAYSFSIPLNKQNITHNSEERGRDDMKWEKWY